MITKGKEKQHQQRRALNYMYKNITETAKTLTKMGAKAQTTQKVVNKITEGIGKEGRAIANNVVKVEAGTATGTESTIKVVEATHKDKNR